MARKPQPDFAVPLHKSLARPTVYLMRMVIFLALVGFITAIVSPMLIQAFKTNPALNGLILGVLFFGVLFAFRQVLRLFPEIKWVNGFRIADPGLANGPQPTLLSPMATMLRERTGTLSLSTVAMRSIMDSIGTRLDEARDTGRYLVGLLVFLGLLGTFWGLLETIQSVGNTIATLNTGSNDAGIVFEDLKAGLAAPLKGMGTAFSASLIGLSGSLILGFLELQASHAHNRFYNELEEWLSGITDLSPATTGGGDAVAARQLQVAVFDMQRAVTELAERLQTAGVTGATGADSGAPVRELAHGVDQLVRQMRSEQKVVREWIDEQAARQTEAATVLRDLAQSMTRKGS